MTAPARRSRVRRWGAVLAAPALLALLSIGFYWKLTLSRDYVWFDQPDMAYIEIPRVEFQARALHSWRFPLWDPNIWVGQPLIGQTQPGPLYPLNLLLCLLPLGDGYVRFAALNWHYVLLRFLAALACYWLCRDLRLSRGASLLAGCAFAFTGFLGSVAWLDVANGAITTPLVFLFLLRAVRGERPGRSAALAAVFLGLAWLSGHHEIPLLVTLAAAATWAWFGLFGPWLAGERPRWRLLGLGLVSLVLAMLIGAVQLWPTLEFGRQAVHWVGVPEPVDWSQPVPYNIHSLYSLPARGLLGMLLPAQARYADSSSYVGVVLLGLAALGLLARWEDRRVRWLAALAAVSTVYALGALTPLHGVLYSLVPGLDKARVPVRAVHLSTFALAVLAAYGVDALYRPEARAWLRPVRRVAAALGALVLGVAVVFAVTGTAGLEERVLLGGFVALALAAALAAAERGTPGERRGAALLLGLVLVDIYGVATWTFPHRLDEGRNRFSHALLEHEEIARYLRAQPQPLRVVVEDGDVPINFGDWHGIETMQGYVAGVTGNVRRLGMHTPRTQRLLGIGYRVARKPARPDEVDLYAEGGGVHVYGVPNPMPRGWVVHAAESVAGPEALRARIDDPAFDFSRTAAMLGPAPALAACPGEDTVEWNSRSTDRMRLSVRLSCKGMLVIADTFYPGWHARVDGRAAPVVEVFGALRGIVLEPGFHVVEMSYRPLSVFGGAGLSALGLLAAAILAWRF